MLVPYEKSGNHRRTSSDCKQGNGWCCRCRYPKEIREYTFTPRCVLIEENPHRFVLPQRLQNIPSGVPSLDRNIPAQRPITRDELLYARVVDRTDDKFQWIAIKRMC